MSGRTHGAVELVTDESGLSVEAAVEEDVQYLKQTKLIPDSITITGWVYEVETGKVRQVV